MEETEYFDYLGNKIDVGMTIQFIRTKSLFTKLTDSQNPNITFDVPENTWSVIYEAEVYFQKEYNMLYAKIGNADFTFGESLGYLLDSAKKRNFCVAIKGISDKNINQNK